jgi:cytochrome oxidase Cu insertion factor (SCO1/SenC/PrrC family)
MMTQENIKTRQRNMRQLWVLIAVFALPLIAGWLFHFNPQWLPHGRSNHGTLIDPPRAMQSFTLQTLEKDSFDWKSLQDQWTLVVLAEGQCDNLCIEQLVKVRQIRRALGADRQRVERLLILLPDAQGNLEPPSLDGLEGTRIAISTAADMPAIQRAFTAVQTTTENSLFVIDPRVDLMMVHDMSHITSKQILQDLEKLLKASQNWVKGGQYGH